MLSIIYSEILKLKKSSILFLMLAGAVIMPLLMYITVCALKQSNRTFESYVYNTEGIGYMIIYGILFAIIAGYIFAREYGDKTANSLYSYPCNRIKIFISKIIVIYLILFIICFVQCILVYAGYYKLFGNIDKNLVFRDLKINVQALLFQMALIPISVFLANLNKNVILPIIYGAFTLCFQGMMSGSDSIYAEYNPFLGSFFLFENMYNMKNYNMYITAIVSVVLFIVFISVSIYHHNKMEI